MGDCPGCGAAGAQPALAKDGYQILHCRACDLRFLAHTPSADELAELYSDRYFTEGKTGYPDYIKDERTHRRQARRYLARLGRFHAAPGALLDVGCAAGFFLDEARQRGWDVTGCDISEYARRHAEGVLGLRVVCAPFLEAPLAPSSFDLITLFNVLEHLPQPRAVSERLYGLLRPGGRLLIETWDSRSLVARTLGGKWHQYAPPHVLSWHSRRSLDALFAAPRWRRIHFERSAKWISLEHGLTLLAELARSRGLARALGALGHSRLGSFEVPYYLGDLVLVGFQRDAEAAASEPLQAALRQ